MAKRNALGRGLGALIDNADNAKESAKASMSNEISISEIEANPYQPRINFDREALAELATSIKENGIIQPITLRKLDGGKFQIIAGERRIRAAKEVGLKKIPAFIREAGDDEMLELALVENVQREDLDAIEVALSYQRLIDECQLTQESLSDKVGKRRSTISNYIRLLKLPATIQKAIREQKISMGHAKSLINITDHDTQIKICRQIEREDLSVRKTEELVRRTSLGNEIEGKLQKAGVKIPKEYHILKNHLEKHFSTSVDFRINNSGKGKIMISFSDTNELERIIGIFDRLNS